ncbi:MAG: site-specific integrase [Terriglobales bacterium]|jgi:integrase
MKRAARYKTGSVVFDKRRKTWNFLWWEGSKRRSRLIGTLKEFRTKGAAQGAAQTFLPDIQRQPSENPRLEESEILTVNALATRYEGERLPSRHSTARMYRSWLRNHILPKWGDSPISEVQPRPVELWLRELNLSPKSKAHVRGILHLLMEFAMWSGALEISRNPIDLVVVKGATKRTRQPRSLTVEEFRKFVQHLEEPFRTMALLSVCFGLRISECLALKWCDVDWLNGKMRIERAIVRQHVDAVKTIHSQKEMGIDPELLGLLKMWKQTSQFSADGDWLFASPVQLGRLPWSYPQVLRIFHRAAETAGIGKVPTHTLRHSYRSWLDAVGTPIAVQQKLMRHSDIRTTMNIYGEVVTDEMAQAHSKVVGLALALGTPD